MRRLCKPLLCGAVLLLASACAKDEAALVGSLGNFYDLRHEEVRARLYPSELAIEFVRETEEVPVRITVRTDEPLEAGGSYDLVERGEISGRQDGVEIPRYRTGTLRLEVYQASHLEPIRGEFEATFETGRDVASLAGRFDTALEVIERVDGYSVDVSFIDVEQFRQ